MKYIVLLMIKLLVENQDELEIPSKLALEKWVNRSMEVLDLKVDGVLEMYFVSSEHIRKLNMEHRGKDTVTDVLSFSFLEGEKFPGDDLVGQIFLEPEIAKKQAMEHGVSWAEEVEFLFVHALLHVFGYDHEKPEDFKLMFGLQEKIMPDQRWVNYADQIYQEYFGQ